MEVTVNVVSIELDVERPSRAVVSSGDNVRGLDEHLENVWIGEAWSEGLAVVGVLGLIGLLRFGRLCGVGVR